jgi:L-alanine-DL-glutamate epimerase-like enolase superfamily enzyme
MRTLEVGQAEWEYTTPFRISYQVHTHCPVVQVGVREGDVIGRGEAAGVFYHGETLETVISQLKDVAGNIENGVSRAELQSLLPAGGARNALDCALWDLEAKLGGQRAWELSGIFEPSSLLTSYTLGMDTPLATAEAAAAARAYPLLKLKLGDQSDAERVRQVRAARPEARIIVDANQAWDEQRLQELVPILAALGVELIEQPLPVGHDDFLASFESHIPLCADESCQTSDDIASLTGKYTLVNVKLDKTGGITESLELIHQAQAAALGAMVGCMGGSSLAMAPAFLVGQLCSYVDLDGPLLLRSDVPHAIQYEGAWMRPPARDLWG